MRAESSSELLLSLQVVKIIADMLKAVSENRFIEAAEHAEHSLLLAELATGRANPKLRQIVEEMKSYK